MVKRKTKHITFKDFEKRCKEIAKLISKNKKIKDIFGVPKGGNIMATRISYLTGLPLTNNPKNDSTVILDDCLESGSTRHSFGNFNYFFVLVDRQFEEIKEWVSFWWEEK